MKRSFHFTPNIRIQAINIEFQSDDNMRCQDYIVKTIGLFKEYGFSIIDCGTSVTDRKTHYFTFQKLLQTGGIIKLIVFSRLCNKAKSHSAIAENVKFLIYVNDFKCKNYREMLMRIRKLVEAFG